MSFDQFREMFDGKCREIEEKHEREKQDLKDAYSLWIAQHTESSNKQDREIKRLLRQQRETDDAHQKEVDSLHNLKKRMEKDIAALEKQNAALKEKLATYGAIDALVKKREENAVREAMEEYRAVVQRGMADLEKDCGKTERS